MSKWFHGVFEARVPFLFSADRLYRIYLTDRAFYFIRIGGQRLLINGRPWLVDTLLDMIQRYQPGLASRLDSWIAHWLEGRSVRNEEILDTTPPDKLVSEHKHSFVIDLQTLADLSLTKPLSAAMWGESLGVLSFRDPTGYRWRFLLEEDCHFVTAIGLLLTLKEDWHKDDYICRALEAASLQFELGCGFELGETMPRDMELAIAWYRRAAEQGHAPGQCRLSFLTHQGICIPQDDRMALYWCYKAVAQNYPPALTLMGDFYERGLGVEPSLEKAIHWYQKAAELEDSRAMFLLAEKYEKGQGVLRDYQAAKSWYLRAAEQGFLPAQLAVAKLFSQGLGIPRDYHAAAFWFHRAALQNNQEAQFRIGQLYEWGYGVTRNEAMAARWYLLAAQQNYQTAKEALSRLQERGITVVPAQSME